ncbi:MAG: hypothetical protein FWB76_02285 [Oscillospiraceae bacterium]|nr:hypothetical protein [Oscillospiraceae bacterium]
MTKPYRIWIGCAAAWRVLTLVALGFFVLGPFGLVPLALLHWITYLSGVHLLVSVLVWLWREKLHTRAKKVAAAVTAGLLAVAVGFVFFIASLFMAMGGTTMYTPHTISRSPEGSNRVIVYQTGFERDILVASPMVNRWVYRREPTHGTGARNLLHNTQVEWLGEHRAVVRLFTLDGEALELPDGLIVVEFPR